MNSLLYLPSTTSTNDIVTELADPKQSNINAAYTFNQTNGRGQYGNTWTTPINQNIAYSFIIPEKAIKLSPALFNFYTALLMRDFLAKITDNEVFLKWPNDIIIHNKKVVGILLEKKTIAKTEYYIAGFGLNVLQENFGDITKAGSLKTQTGKSFDLTILADEMHNYFSQHIFSLENEEKILQKYLEHLYRKNQVSVFEIKGIRQNGIIQNVDTDGFLYVELEHDGLQKFFHKEISLLY